jgi:phospholipid/cholesterol/gamma-HCH transport system substrate-binding protein
VSRTLSTLQAIVLGVVVLLGLGVIAGAVYVVAAKQWFGQDALHVRAGFRNAGGVEVGTPVRIQGVTAGEVVAVEPPGRKGKEVLVRMRIRGDFRHLVGQDSVAQIVSVGMLGAKAVEIAPGDDDGPPAEDDTLLASKPASEITDVLDQVKTTLENVVEGDGTVGLLVRDPQAYQGLVALLNQARTTLTSIQQDADAVKNLPLVGKYVEDPQRLLVRPREERNRKWFREAELFEDGRAVLTSDGQDRLDGLKGWLDGLKHSGSEVVVVAYADRQHPDPARARTVSTQQARAVTDYLKERLGAHKMGIVSRRKVLPLGLGVSPPPTEERDKLPAPRVEVLVFVPQK